MSENCIKGFSTKSGKAIYDFNSLGNIPRALKDIPIAKVGQILCVKSVDENGVITAVEGVTSVRISGGIQSINNCIFPDESGDAKMDWGTVANQSRSYTILKETAITKGLSKVLYYGDLEGHDEVIVYYDGIPYRCIPEFGYAEGDGYWVHLGNKHLLSSSQIDTGEPFLFWGYKISTSLIANFAEGDTHSIAITSASHEYVRIPEEYLPDTIKELVFKDRVTGSKYRICVKNGKLVTEAV